MIKVLLVIFGTLCFISASFSQSSVLGSGQWYKIPVEENGVYKLTYDFLGSAGMPVDEVDPTRLKVYGNAGGMLPQPNSDTVEIDPMENAILVVGEEDGSFDPGDYVLFYGFGPHDHAYEPGGLSFDYNVYSDQNYYFITADGEKGIRVEPQPNEGNAFPTIDSFDDYRHYETEGTNFLISGREWYGERFDVTTTYDFTFAFEGVVPSSLISVTSDVMAQSFAESSFDVSLNGAALGSQTVSPVPNFEEPRFNNPFRYNIKGRTSHDLFTLPANQVADPSNLAVRLSYNKNSSRRSIGYLNYLRVEVERRLQLYDDQVTFRSLGSLANAQSTFQIQNVSPGNMTWDITQRGLPRDQAFNLEGSVASFGSTTSSLREFVVFNPGEVPVPSNIESIPNQNIKGISTPTFLIITHPDFLSQANRLADFRRQNDNMTVAVVTTEQVYNEFSSGKQDVSAIRNYAKFLYDKSSELKYLLLFGKGSYDYKNVLTENRNFVPIYQSYNSLHPLDTYASDDYYGFMEEDEGAWLEINGGNHTLDIGVGRFPVSTLEEARVMVDKVIRYTTDPRSLGAWRNETVFVADDGDSNLHHGQADELSSFVETTFNDYNTNKLYLDAFPQISRPNGETSPEARKALGDIVEQGALIVNFTGHGAETGWMQEQVLDLFLIDQWSNRYQLPLFVTATCEFSRHDDPRRVSGGERVVTHERGGGIAIVSTCRPVASDSNFELNKAFYNSVFELEDGELPRLGDVFRRTKNESIDLAQDTRKVGNRNFALLGDPSLRLAYPKERMVITNLLEGEVPTDTLRAMAHMKLRGEIQGQDNLLASTFNGTLDITIFDDEVSKTTFGNSNAPFTFESKENKIFKGSATVTDGKFEVEFVVPKNISQSYEPGKISLYAHHNDGVSDAHGAEINVVVGGTTSAPPTDTSGPGIQLYVGDTLNTRVTDISHNTVLYALLEDENGINISGFGISNSITAELDEDAIFVLNDFYTARKDNFREGWVIFPLDDLEEGRHVLRLKAWDTFNNPGEAEIEFFVADPNNLVVTGLKNSPNPVRSNTLFSFEHNRAGEDLEANLQIISSMGELVRDLDFEIVDSLPVVDLFEWDATGLLGQKLLPGIYLYRLTVRSILDGAKGQYFQKLILIN